MADITFRITGDRELAATFNRLQAATRGQMLINALEAGARPVLNDAKRRVPVDTGNLQGSIHLGGQSSTGNTAEVAVGTDVEYAGYVEYGTSRMPAQPYLRPALESSKGEVHAEVSSAVGNLIRSAVG